MKKNTSIFAVATTAIIGCGLCCLPFLLPLIAGTASISIFNLSQDEILCGSIFLGLTLILSILYMKRKKKSVCEIPTNKQ